MIVYKGEAEVMLEDDRSKDLQEEIFLVDKSNL